MSSKIENLNAEEQSNNLSIRKSGKDGFYVKKSLAIFIVIVISLIYVGSILATYFGKPDTSKIFFILLILIYKKVKIGINTTIKSING